MKLGYIKVRKTKKGYKAKLLNGKPIMKNHFEELPGFVNQKFARRYVESHWELLKEYN